jgi:hypothetical protein
MTNNQSSKLGVEAPRRLLTALAWSVILILTTPQIIYRFFVPLSPGEQSSPLWLALIQVCLLAVLVVLAWVWPILKPLRGFFLALLALFVGDFFVLPFIGENVAWSNWKQSVSWGVAQVANRLEVHLVLTGLMALTLIGSGIGRRELFLVRGNPSAPASPSRFLQGNRSMPWNKVVRGWLPFYIIIFLGLEWFLVHPDLSKISGALIYLPAIVIMAAINAFGEEFQYRSMVLARLEPVLGSQQAILMAAALFGLMHYFGDPGSVPGVLLAGYLGWIAAKSMIETRSIVWAFLIHFIGDFLLYIIWAMVA